MRTLRDIPARPSLPVRAILRTYPRAWRERYEHELGAMLAATPPRAGQLLDLLAGAIDARLHRDLMREPGFLRLATAGPVVDPPAPTYGAVPGVAIGELSRRTFLRRMLGVGAGLLALEFIGGTLAFLWPQISEGLGSEFRLGTLADIERAEPAFATGTPYAYGPARVFLVNVPAAEAVARGEPFTPAQPSAAALLALWRKCPHLGCQIPAPCSDIHRFQCRCHGSTFNILGEKMRAGPAPRGLDRFTVRIDAGGTVIVDTSHRIAGAPAGDAGGLTFDDGRPFEATCFPV